MTPKITIKHIPPNFARYFDWLITGLGELEAEGKCTVAFDLNPLNSLLANRYLRHLTRRAWKRLFYELDREMFCMEATYECGGEKINLIYEIYDNPSYFDLNRLEQNDLYFKAQYPVNFPEPFPYTKDTSIPLAASVLSNQEKIVPAMLGRPLARSLDWKKNKRVLQKWEQQAGAAKNKKLFAYFGGVTQEQLTPTVWKGIDVSHPNAKRAEVVKILQSFDDPRVDARLVSGIYPERIKPAIKKQTDFARHVAESNLNVNVSGLYCSLPFRFIDSLMLGTALATDTPLARWYMPFEKEVEVYDLGRMGYDPFGSIDWSGVKNHLKKLSEIPQKEMEERGKRILERYHQYWAPRAFAGYFLEICDGVIEKRLSR